MARHHWLIKSEPQKYPFERLLEEGRTTWDGVRNYAARNNLRAMKKGDPCLYYHSNEDKAVIGIARVVREAFQDPTTSDDFSAVDFEPVRKLARPVSLDELRSHRGLGKMMIFRQPRLSVVPLTREEFDLVLELAKKP